MEKFVIKRYNDVWLDNGLVTLYEILRELRKNYEEKNILGKVEISPFEMTYEVINMAKFLKYFSSTIKDQTSNLIVNIKDKETNEKKEVKKDHILIQEKAKIGGKVHFKEEIYDPNECENTIKMIFDNINGNKNQCFICGKEFKSSIKKIQQASYPFVTKIKSLSGIRSGKEIKLKEYFTEYCPHCYLSGIVEWLDEGMVYRTIPGKKSIIILPMTGNLKEMYDIKKRYKNILNNTERWSNIKISKRKSEIDQTGSAGKYSTLISFYENFLYVTKIVKEMDWYLIEIPYGSVKNLRINLIIFDPVINELLYKLLAAGGFFYRVFIKEFYVFYNDISKGIRNFAMERTLGEQICQALTINDFALFADVFIPRKGIHIGMTKEARMILDNTITIWRLSKMNIENKEQFLKTLNSAGRTIANLIGNRLGLFFKLEKTRNLTEFLKVIQEITRRLIIKKDDFTNNLDEYNSNKNEKSLVSPLSIFTILEEMIKRQSETDKNFFEDTKNIILIYASLNVFKKDKKMEVSNE
jgi:hypothetical protein